MANNEYTHISIILDRSGSMETLRSDTIGGFNAFLKEQQEQPGKATLTLVQFDSQDPYEVLCDFKSIREVPGLTYQTFVPRSATPLLDAVGRGINDIESKISVLKKSQAPENIVFMIITDGQENSSREFKLSRIKEMVKEKTAQGWHFLFLSADLQSFSEAGDMGYDANISVFFDSGGTRDSWSVIAEKTTAFRRSKRSMSFDEEDRRKMKKGD